MPFYCRIRKGKRRKTCGRDNYTTVKPLGRKTCFFYLIGIPLYGK